LLPPSRPETSPEINAFLADYMQKFKKMPQNITFDLLTFPGDLTEEEIHGCVRDLLELGVMMEKKPFDPKFGFADKLQRLLKTIIKLNTMAGFNRVNINQLQTFLTALNLISPMIPGDTTLLSRMISDYEQLYNEVGEEGMTDKEIKRLTDGLKDFVEHMLNKPTGSRKKPPIPKK